MANLAKPCLIIVVKNRQSDERHYYITKGKLRKLFIALFIAPLPSARLGQQTPQEEEAERAERGQEEKEKEGEGAQTEREGRREEGRAPARRRGQRRRRGQGSNREEEPRRRARALTARRQDGGNGAPAARGRGGRVEEEGGSPGLGPRQTEGQREGRQEGAREGQGGQAGSGRRARQGQGQREEQGEPRQEQRGAEEEVKSIVCRPAAAGVN